LGVCRGDDTENRCDAHVVIWMGLRDISARW
jgi:hypothetical protein